MKAAILNADGKPMKNQIVLTDESSTSLQSYDTVVVRKQTTTTLDPMWSVSKTTIKAVCAFLGEENKKAVEAGITQGKYIIGLLNEATI